MFKVDEAFDLRELPGRSGGERTEIKAQLIEAMRDLPVDPLKSIKIDKEHYKTRNATTTMISQIKSHLRETYPQLNGAEYATRSFNNSKGEYYCTRVWRIK